jgi:hypothetical protein
LTLLLIRHIDAISLLMPLRHYAISHYAIDDAIIDAITTLRH